MRKGWHKGGFTVEASVIVPIEILMIITSLSMGIDLFQYSARREIAPRVQELRIVDEFYNYQILGEIGKEIVDD